MKVVELAGVIFTLSIKMLISVIFTQLLKATSGKKTAWLGSHKLVAAKKLQRFARQMHLGVLALTL